MPAGPISIRRWAQLAQILSEPPGAASGLARDDPRLTVGSNFAGHRIDAFVARGGMGQGYRATDSSLQRAVALKVIAPEVADAPVFRARFEREYRLAAALDHPNVVEVFHAGEEHGLLYLTMRYVDGAHGAAVDARADIYSLGCMLHEMLTGGVVFDRDGDLEKLWAHVHDRLQNVLDHALAKEPQDRQQSAAELAREVAEALNR